MKKEMKRSEKKGLHFVGPEIEQGWFSSTGMEYRALHIPNGMTAESVGEDVRNGASMFGECFRKGVSADNHMTLVLANSYEEGISAVTYLIGLRMDREKKEEQERIERELRQRKKKREQERLQVRSTLEATVCIPEDGKASGFLVVTDEDELPFEPGHVLRDCSEEPDDEDPDDEDYDEDELVDEFLREEAEDWYYRRDRAGIIGIHELMRECFHSEFDLVGFSSADAEAAGVGSRMKRQPYWREGEIENLVVVKSDVCWDEDASISNKEIESFRILRNVKYVYFVLIKGKKGAFHSFPFFMQEQEEFGEEVEEEEQSCSGFDIGVCGFLIEYTADKYLVDSDETQRGDYRRRVFYECVKRRGLKLKRGFPIDLVLDHMGKLTKFEDCFFATVDKVLKFILHTREENQQGTGKAVSHTLTGEDFAKAGIFELVEKEDEKKKDEEDTLYGLEDVKRKMDNIVSMMKFTRIRKLRNMSSTNFHNVHLFEGAPGTAKTTMAKILGRKMQSENLLKGGRFISLTGAELKGKYVGHTAPKIHKLFQEYDIIFIDEAYSLSASSNGELDIYSQEALAQLAVELESHAMDKLVIFAGYGGKAVSEKNNKMKEFLDANPGIQSRINTTVEFSSYTAQEILQIIHGIMEESGYRMSHDMDCEICRFFEDRVTDVNFGNGREARSFVEACQMKLAERIMKLPESELTEEELSTILPEDICKAIEEKKSELTSYEGRKRGIGFAV